VSPGISYITDQRSQWYSYVQSWIQRREDDSQERKAIILSMFDRYVDDTLLTLKKEFKHMCPMLDFNLVQSLCHVLSGLLISDNVPANDPNEATRIETYFTFAAIWAFGSCYSITDGTDYRKNFSAYWKGKWTNIKMPSKGSVFDYFIDRQSQKFVPWSQVVPQIEYVSTTPMDAVTVPTGETTSISFYLDLLVELRRPALLVGLAGAGKTALINGKLRVLPEDYSSLTINFNYYTGSWHNA
jgi:dynein heavy chain, axonemal